MYYKFGQACVTNQGSFILLQIWASVVTNWRSYYKLGQRLLQARAAITNLGRYYKFGQVLLQIGVAITNQGNGYYKLGQLLQIWAGITNWGNYYKLGHNKYLYTLSDKGLLMMDKDYTISKQKHDKVIQFIRL